MSAYRVVSSNVKTTPLFNAVGFVLGPSLAMSRPLGHSILPSQCRREQPSPARIGAASIESRRRDGPLEVIVVRPRANSGLAPILRSKGRSEGEGDITNVRRGFDARAPLCLLLGFELS